MFVQAHADAVNDVIIHDSKVISCGRDHMIQIFEKQVDGLSLVQTIDQHVSSVNRISLLGDKPLLVSLSSDRTVNISSLASLGDSKAFVNVQTIMLKHSPLSCALNPQDSGTLIITTADKQCLLYQIVTGQMISATKLLDDGGPVTMQSLTLRRYVIDGRLKSVLFGNSAKSIRVHDLETGAGLVSSSGQSEALTSTTVLHESRDGDFIKSTLITTSYDGTVRKALPSSDS